MGEKKEGSRFNSVEGKISRDGSLEVGLVQEIVVSLLEQLHLDFVGVLDKKVHSLDELLKASIVIL